MGLAVEAMLLIERGADVEARDKASRARHEGQHLSIGAGIQVVFVSNVDMMVCVQVQAQLMASVLERLYAAAWGMFEGSDHPCRAAHR